MSETTFNKETANVISEVDGNLPILIDKLNRFAEEVGDFYKCKDNMKESPFGTFFFDTIDMDELDELKIHMLCIFPSFLLRFKYDNDDLKTIYIDDNDKFEKTLKKVITLQNMLKRLKSGETIPQSEIDLLNNLTPEN